MTEPQVWPPPPETPNLLAAYDEFLVAYICNWKPKQPTLRLQLAGKLHRETGQDLRSCMAVVNNFCDRHAILVPQHGLVVWSPILLPLIMITIRTAVACILEQRHDAAITHAERMMITAEERQADLAVIGVWVIVTIIAGIFAFFRDKRTRRQAAEAKAKFAR